MSVQDALTHLVARQDLDATQMQAAMRQIMGGEATPALFEVIESSSA